MIFVRAFQFPPDISKILILGSAAPTAINTALIVHEFKGDTQFATATVFYSTLLSVLVVTTLLGFLESGFY